MLSLNGPLASQHHYNISLQAAVAEASSLDGKVHDLQKQLKEKEARENKYKQLVLKAKKEAAEFKQKVGRWQGRCVQNRLYSSLEMFC